MRIGFLDKCGQEPFELSRSVSRQPPLLGYPLERFT
jgi:hypothetical protein